MREPGLGDELVLGISRLTFRTLGGYAAIVLIGFTLISYLLLHRSMTQSAAVVESLIGLYADPGGERTTVAPAMLADQLVGMGSRFIITRRTDDGDGMGRTYYLTPGMPAKEISGLESKDAVVDAILAALSGKRWQYQILHRPSGEFDIFVAADRIPYLFGVFGVGLAALLILPLAATITSRTIRRVVSEHLAPVEHLTSEIEGIDPSNLSRRVSAPTGLAETSSIASSVNQLLFRVESSQQALTAFTADASHELRTPITYLRAQAQWALDEGRSDEELRDALAAISDEAERMRRLVEGLLLLARGDNRDLAVRREVFAVEPLVAEVAEITHGMSSAANLDVLVDVPDGTHALGDEGHTRQVLLNLVSNAVRHTPSGTITIGVESTDDIVRIAVRDTGVGIAADQLPRLFDRFARVESSRSRDHGGAGLGLAIAKTLTEVQGGMIYATSTPGSGSEFVIELPTGEKVSHSPFSPPSVPAAPGRQS